MEYLKGFDQASSDEDRLSSLRALCDAVYLSSLSEPECVAVIKKLLSFLLQTSSSLLMDSRHWIRHTALEILSRLPLNLGLKTVADEMLNGMIRLLQEENEPNALICIKIIIELYRCFPMDLQPKTQLIQYIAYLFQNLRQAFNSVFQAPPLDSNRLRSSKQSFKVIGKCPYIVSILFQIHSQSLQSLFPSLIHPMINSLRLEVNPQTANQQKQEFLDYLEVQVRTLNFLYSVMKTEAQDWLKTHGDTIAKLAINILRIAPKEAIFARRDVLLGIRHFLKTEVRKSFLKHIDELMDEKLVLGQDCVAPEMLRPAACFMLGDIVKHMKGQFNPSQLSKLIQAFGRNLHDPLLPFSVQTVSVKRLFDLIENVFAMKAETQYTRLLLLRILNCVVDKLENIEYLIPSLIEFSSRNESNLDDESFGVSEDENVDGIQTYIGGKQKYSLSSISEAQLLIHSCLQGMRNLLMCLGQLAVKAGLRTVPTLNAEDAEVLAKFLTSGLSCLALFHKYPQINSAISGTSISISAPSKAPSRESLELFAESFSVIDTATFRRVFGHRLGIVFEKMVLYTELPMATLPRQFLFSSVVSRVFCEMLLVYLMTEIDNSDLNQNESASAVFLSTFGHLMSSLSLFSDNEAVIRPHVRLFVEKCLEKSSSAENPLLYLKYLRLLFRAINGGRFESLQVELLPLVETIPKILLDVLEKHTASVIARSKADLQSLNDLVIELCLTVPARLANLIPVMPLMMKAVVRALKSSNEVIVKSGLRTMEIWVMKVKHEFLYLQMSNCYSEIMTALCDLLHSNELGFTNIVIRILGKLGGRNRLFLLNNLMLDYKPSSLEPLNLPAQFNGNQIYLKTSSIMDGVIRVLLDDTRSDIERSRAIELSHAMAMLYLDLASSKEVQFSLGFDRMDIEGEVQKADPNFVLEEHFISYKESLKRIISAIIHGCSLPFVDSSQVHSIVQDLSTAWTTLSIASSSGTFDLKLLIKMSENCTSAFLEALLEGLCSQIEHTHKLAKLLLETYLSKLLQTFGVSRDDPESSQNESLAALLDKVFQVMCHACYSLDVRMVFAGTVGIRILCESLPSWILTQNHLLPELLRALLFSLRDSDNQTAAKSIFLSRKSLSWLTSLYFKVDPDSVQTLMDSPDSACQEVSNCSTEEMNSFVYVIFHEMISPVCSVRSTIHDILKVISIICQRSLSEIWDPFIQRLLHPVLTNTLDSVSMGVRIGFLSAATKSFNLDPPLVKLTPELKHLLSATTQFIIAINQESIGPGFVGSTARKLTRQELVLRVESINFAATAAISPILNDSSSSNAESTKIRHHITLVLFRSLMNPVKDIVDAAKKGLKDITQRETLPKDLLQECLRPILLNLSDVRKLNNNLLKLLEHLLELLSSCFNPTLGEKLLDHLFYFSEALKTLIVDNSSNESNPNSSGSSMNEIIGSGNHEIRMPAAIIDLFHLLPPAPRQFLTKLVMNVVNLEGILPRLKSYGESAASGKVSPFREPLIKFLNKYAAETVAFFLTPKNLVEPTLSNLFLSILDSNEGTDIRETLMFSYDQLLAATFNIEQSQRQGSGSNSGNASDSQRRQIPQKAIEQLQLQGICILHVLSRWSPDWLANCPKVIRSLLTCWKNHTSSITRENELQWEHVKKWKLVAECLMVFCSKNKTNVGVLWTLLPAFVHRTLVDYSFLQRFFIDVIAGQSTSEEKKFILREYFSNVLLRPGLHSVLKVSGLQRVIIPIIDCISSSHQDDLLFILDTDMANLMVDQILASQQSSPFSEDIKVELIHLYCLLFHTAIGCEIFSSDQISKITQFCLDQIDGWDFQGNNDYPLSKNQVWSLQFLAIIAHKTETLLFDQMVKVYTRVLQSTAPEPMRKLTEFSLDTLLPILCAKSQETSVGQSESPSFVSVLLKILQDYSTSAMITAWGVVLRNKNLFFPYRQEFCSSLVPCLSRLGILERPLAQRRLALGIYKTIIEWTAECEDRNYESFISEALAVELIQLLIRFITISIESNESRVLMNPGLALLRRGLALWKHHSSISTRNFQESFQRLHGLANHRIASQSLSQAYGVYLDCCNALANELGSSFVETNLLVIQSLLRICLNSNLQTLRIQVSTLVGHIFRTLSHRPNSEGKREFQTIFVIPEVFSVIEKASNTKTLVQFPLVLDILSITHLEEPHLFSDISSLILKMAQILQTVIEETSSSVQVSEGANSYSEEYESLRYTLSWIWNVRKRSTETMPKSLSQVIIETILLVFSKVKDFTLLESCALILEDWIDNDYASEAVEERRENIFAILAHFEKLVRADLRLKRSYLGLGFKLINIEFINCTGRQKSQLIDLLLFGIVSDDVDFQEKFRNYFCKLCGATLFDQLSFIFSETNLVSVYECEWLAAINNCILAHISLNSKPSFFPQLRNLAMENMELSATVFESMFPLIWGSFSISEKNELRLLLEKFLLSQAVRDKLMTQWNFGRSLLNVIAQYVLSGNLFEISPQCLSYLSSQVGNLPSTMLILENMLYLNEKDLRHGNSEMSAEVASCLLIAYERANEMDFYTGLLQDISCSPFTRAGLSLSQFGLWPRAQSQFFYAMKARQLEEMNNDEDQNSKHSPLLILESQIWEQEWLRCSKNLNQWKDLHDFSKSACIPELALECSWKLGDWELLQNITSQFDVTSSLTGRTHLLYLETHRVFTQELHRMGKGKPDWAIKFAKIKEVSESSFQKALDEWQLLPRTPCTSHVKLLSNFQQLVEVQDSVELLGVLSKTPLTSFPDLKHVLNIWRDRLPNEWEGIPIWSDIFTLRNHVFLFLTQHMKARTGSNLTVASQWVDWQDTAWTVLKFAETARRHQLPMICLTSLSNLGALGHPLQPDENFARIKEQVRVCADTPNEHQAVVNLVNQTDIDSFTEEQKAELLSLKGESLHHLGLAEESNSCFAGATSICSEFGDGWFSWANLCDQAFSQRKDPQWAQYAIACYLQAIKYNPSHSTRFMISRVLWLLSFDNSNLMITKVFEKYVDQLPLWVWIMWIPQFLTSLSRIEGPVLKNILLKIAAQYPQALFYSARAQLLEKKSQKDSEDGRPGPKLNDSFVNTSEEGTNLSSLSIKDSENVQEASLKSLSDILSMIREKHKLLASDMDKMLDEITRRFKPSIEEDLYSNICNLFLRCSKNISQKAEEIPEIFITAIQKVFQRFFQQNNQMAKNKRLEKFFELYQNDFTNDLSVDSPDFPKSTSDLLQRLHHWKVKLASRIDVRARKSISLEKISPYFVRYDGFGMEIPGQYNQDDEPRVSMNVTLTRFLPDVTLVHIHGYPYRRIGMLGSDGKKYYFLIQIAVSYCTKTDERLSQLYLILNRSMLKRKETRDRNLYWDLPIVIPVNHRLRLVKDDENVVSLESIYERSCLARHWDPDQPLLEYRKSLMKESAYIISQGVSDVEIKQLQSKRSKVLRSLMEETFPGMCSLLKEFLMGITLSVESFWHLRKEFCKQVALSGFLTFIMQISDRSLHKLSLNLSSGRIINSEFLQAYGASNLIEHADPVPFRLSQSMLELTVPALLKGVMPGTLVGTSAILLKNQDIFKNFFYLYLRDDTLAWNVMQKPALLTDDALQREFETSSRQSVLENTLRILQRVQSMMNGGADGTMDPSTPYPITFHAENVIRFASQIENHALMNPSWTAWF